MRQFELTLRVMRLFGGFISLAYLAIGVQIVYSVYPKLSSLSIVGIVLWMTGFLLGLFASFPRKQLQLVDHSDCLDAAAHGMLVFFCYIRWNEGKFLVIKTRAVLALVLSIIIFVTVPCFIYS